MNSVQVKVAEMIASIAPSVEMKIVDTLVSRELERRSTALVQVIDKLTKEESSFKRLGPDLKTFDEQGNKVSEYFSATRTKERDDAQKRITKMTGAINKALEKSEFSDVFNLAGGKGSSGDTGQGEVTDQAA